MATNDSNFTFATPNYFDQPDPERQFKVTVEDRTIFVSKDDLMFHVPVYYALSINN